MKPIAWLTLACVGAAMIGAACSQVPRSDTHCSPDSPSFTVDPGCIYAGSGKGPKFDEDPCPAVEGTKPASCATTFDKMLDMMTDSKRGNCTATACHGDPGAAAVGIYLDPGDPAAFYAVLTSTTGSVGTPYVVADDPSTPDNEAVGSWIQCNVTASPGGGYPMPTWSGLMEPADADLVDAWLLCGAPGPT
jgi:hypothetical protein